MRASHLASDLGKTGERIRDVDRLKRVKNVLCLRRKVMYREIVKLPYRGDWKPFNFIIVCREIKKKKLRRKKNDCAQHNELGASFVSQVV